MSFGNEQDEIEEQEWLNAPLGKMVVIEVSKTCEHGQPECHQCKECSEVVGRLVAYQDAYERSLHLTGKALSDWLKAKAEGK